MTVRPTPSGQIPGKPIGRTDRTGSPAPASRPAEQSTPAAPGVRADEVRISAQARQLHQADAAARGSGGELAPARLRQILGRMSDGHYDQPEVQDQVVRRLSREL